MPLLLVNNILKSAMESLTAGKVPTPTKDCSPEFSSWFHESSEGDHEIGGGQCLF